MKKVLTGILLICALGSRAQDTSKKTIHDTTIYVQVQDTQKLYIYYNGKGVVNFVPGFAIISKMINLKNTLDVRVLGEKIFDDKWRIFKADIIIDHVNSRK